MSMNVTRQHKCLIRHRMPARQELLLLSEQLIHWMKKHLAEQ